MQHKAETDQLFRIFCRISAAGGKVKFSTESNGGRCSAKLEIETGLISADTPGAAGLHSAKRAHQQTHRPCHRGPASKARSRARAAAFRAGKAAAAAVAASEQSAQESESPPGGLSTTKAPSTPSSPPHPPPPPPPPPPYRRQIAVIRNKTRNPHLWQLDGETGERDVTPDEEEDGISLECTTQEGRGSNVESVTEDESPKRQIPDIHTWAKPLRSDERFTIRGNLFIDGYEEIVVFAPPGIPLSQIKSALKPDFDWDHIRPTSYTQRKWVYYP